MDLEDIKKKMLEKKNRNNNNNNNKNKDSIKDSILL